MENCCIIENIQIKLNRASVFHIMDCYEDSPVYDEVVDTYNELESWVMEHGDVKAVLAWEEDTHGLEAFDGLMYMLTTIGPEIEAGSSKAFADGDYLAGMLLDSMADDYLFQIEDAISDAMRMFCGKIGRGIAKRMEAPNDVSMEFQKIALDVCGVADAWNIGLSSGLMYSPVKTNCVIFGLTKDKEVFNAQHDCNHCPATGCKMRKVNPR